MIIIGRKKGVMIIIDSVIGRVFAASLVMERRMIRKVRNVSVSSLRYERIRGVLEMPVL